MLRVRGPARIPRNHWGVGTSECNWAVALVQLDSYTLDMVKNGDQVQVTGYLSAEGEVLPIRKAGPTDKVPGGFVFMACTLGDQFLTRDDLTSDDKILLLRLAFRMEYGNTIEFTKAGIADELGRHRVAVGRTIEKLVAKGILIKGSVRGSYLIDPHLVWKGDSGYKRTALRRIRELSTPTDAHTGDGHE